jgi:hypothetical protein
MSSNSDAPPLSVSLAIRCLWGSFVINCISDVITYFGPTPNPSQIMFGRLNLLIAMALATFLIRFLAVYFVMGKLLQGKNWARVLCIWIGVVALPVSLAANYRQLDPFLLWISIGLHICYLLFGYYALYLLLVNPAKAWFQRKKAATA